MMQKTMMMSDLHGQSGHALPTLLRQHRADFVAEVVDGRSESAGGIRGGALPCRLVGWERRLGWRDLSAPYAPPGPVALLRERRGGNGRRLCGELGEPAQILGDCCQRELILCTPRSAQPETAELQDALQMGEQHLDALAITA